MSIKINNLTKKYGSQIALDSISFEVNQGEIVGFLGPNGAGKSTTMKILTGYISGNEGDVKIMGLDIKTHGLEIKKNVGYLPEHNPLYLEMNVKEFLNFIGELYGIKAEKLKKRIIEILDLVGLTNEQNKKIKELSKGFRQRVGLAQALIHDPKVLILDEPTSNFDHEAKTWYHKMLEQYSQDRTIIIASNETFDFWKADGFLNIPEYQKKKSF